MRHAWLIIAHNEFGILQKLVSMLDDERSDFYVHIDKKVAVLPELHVEKGRLTFLQKRINVSWGTVSQIRTELLLLDTALKNGPYAHYHILSGTHLPLRPVGELLDYYDSHAQEEIMRFWKYPAVGTGSTTYTGSKGAQTYNFADHPFDWNNMLPTYKRDYTPAQASAVSELMLACGASVNMNYAYDGSGAYSDKVLPALRDYFGYDPAIEFLTDATEDVISTVWVAVLKGEFDAGRPVYYSGANQTSGHAFVMDGYKIDGTDVYFHVNWGWNGSYNGWYLITYLRPQDVNYSAYRNSMVFRIFPPGMGIENTEEQTATKLDMNAPVYTILGNKIPASSMQRGMIYIQNGRKFVW